MADSTEIHPLRELVFEYLERADAEGPAVLDELCAANPDLADALRQRVRALRLTGLLEDSDTDPPQRLGPFRLLDRIGGGGMGVVYKAFDEELGREVALKLIRPSELLFEGARRRFQREIEAVARLSHPGIVPVYQAGEEGDLPYFAMQLVDGCTLAEAVARLSDEGRLARDLTGQDLREGAHEATGKELDSQAAGFFEGSWQDCCARVVREAADALEHAHRRGILHRDVKLSNLMLTTDGRITLIDFGLSSSDDVDRITRSGSAMGSIPYMSPEQLDGAWDSCDRRSDVYSLGVTLFEMLTLELPFREATVTGMRREILAQRTPSARGRNPRISWELDTIVAKAMDPDPDRRYASAAEFAEDLSAALDGRPIRARRASTALRTRRWIRRHPASSVAAAFGALILVAGPWIYVAQERRARLAVEEQRDRAELNFDRALASVDTLLTRFADEELEGVPRLHELRQDLLEDALAFYRELAAERADDPDLRLETARAWRRVGEIQNWLNREEEARSSLEQALALVDGLSGEFPDSAMLASEAAALRRLLAGPLRRLGESERAEEALEEGAAGLLEAAAKVEDPRHLELQRLGIAVERSSMLRQSGRSDEAIVELERLMPELEEVHRRWPEEGQATYHLIRGHQMLGVLLAESSPSSLKERVRLLSRAEDHHATAIQLLEPLVEASPDDRALRVMLGRCYHNFGSAILGSRGAMAEAEPWIRRALSIWDDACRDFPGVAKYEEERARARTLLGGILAQSGQPDEGLELLGLARETLVALVEDAPRNADLIHTLAASELQHLGVLSRLGESEAALELAEHAVRSHERALELAPGMPQMEMGLAWCHELLTRTRLELGDWRATAESALAWSAVAADPSTRADVAACLARCASAVEDDRGIPRSERRALCDEWDLAAADILESALRAGFPGDTIEASLSLSPLLDRAATAELLSAW